MELIRPLDRLTQADLALAGGKGANLGAMLRAGLPVPPGFVVLTTAYRLFVESAGIQNEIQRLAAEAHLEDQESLDAASARIRTLFHQSPIPAEIAAAIAAAYEQLGSGPVAVRSSATAEDLPEASFAGQQETFLNITGGQQVVEAVRRCWSSLWTPRALAYRIRNGIAPQDVALAAVVQRLIPAEVAGVLFTADPLTGHRGRMVIDGAWGLGESVVSGAVTPDHWVVDGRTGAILEERIATKTVMTVRTPDGSAQQPVPPELQRKPVLTPAQVAALVELGRRTAAYFGAPQDIEWALAGGKLYLLQSRPITTLYPLPQPAPPESAGLRIYGSIHGVQGVMEPLSPAARSIFFTLFRTAPGFLGLKVPPGAPPVLVEAGGRLFIDFTAFARTRVGHALLTSGFADNAMGQAVMELLNRNAGRLPPLAGNGRLLLRKIRKSLLLTVAGRALRALVSPDRTREQTWERLQAFVHNLEKESRQLHGVPQRVDFIRNVLSSLFGAVLSQVAPLVVMGVGTGRLAEHKLKAWGLDPALMEPVKRSIPHNPTTQMDLDLWRVSRQLRAEAAAGGAEPPAGAPAAVRLDHPAVAAWLEKYGHRTVREIDVAVPRLREQPEYLSQMLTAFMARDSGPNDPVQHFERGAAAAEQAMAAVAAEVRRRKGPFRAALIRFLMKRHRQLMGVREWPKFFLVHVMGTLRQVLLEAGEELVRAGRLDRQEDVFFLPFEDLTSDQDLRPLVARNRAEYDREMKRRPVPMAITSEGEVSYGIRPHEEGTLVGIGSSAGVYEGVARVVLSPVGARLEPGEVLVAPGTDPAWTPLFLTAGALVTETGGMMSHGSVVAREYGIPAVVGVPGATTRLRTGQRIRVDGTAGTVTILDDAKA
ncbi:MAG TPA: PEP/pyruvate-binding domain-containing protein [Symbiobacteriaceae bacterium]